MMFKTPKFIRKLDAHLRKSKLVQGYNWDVIRGPFVDIQDKSTKPLNFEFPNDGASFKCRQDRDDASAPVKSVLIHGSDVFGRFYKTYPRIATETRKNGYYALNTDNEYDWFKNRIVQNFQHEFETLDFKPNGTETISVQYTYPFAVIAAKFDELAIYDIYPQLLIDVKMYNAVLWKSYAAATDPKIIRKGNKTLFMYRMISKRKETSVTAALDNNSTEIDFINIANSAGSNQLGGKYVHLMQLDQEKTEILKQFTQFKTELTK